MTDFTPVTSDDEQRAAVISTLERSDAYHRLGTPIPEGMSVPEALEYASMSNWDVRTQPLLAEIADEQGILQTVRVREKHAVVRTNPFDGVPEVLGVVGKRWTPFQNEDCGGLLDTIATMSGAAPISMGVLGGGAKTFMCLQLPEGTTHVSPRTGAHDVTNLYMTIFNSHDGAGALSAVITPIRPMCANQQRISESMARTRFQLCHTGDAKLRMQELADVIGESMDYREVYGNQVERMIEREMEDDEVFRELVKLLKANDPDLTDRAREMRTDVATTVLGIYRGSETVAPFRGTAYGAYNAFTEYTDHHMRVVVPDGANERDVRALRTLDSGPLDDLKQRAFAQLVAA